MKDNRPVNLEISTIKLPLAAITSITHRISGIILFAGVAVLLWMLDKSLASEAGFDALKNDMSTPMVKLIVWIVVSALMYHLVAGIKHLLMDLGFGETKTGGPLGARIVLVVSLVLIVMAGVWIW